ncbi:ABC transporter ATP-binding protein [Microbacterium yannicii]|uniref:ABC transporter ATP-binding protein n=1 Tax=Microbacterium yannicii TaxID=671622 RepID=UPI0002EC3C32|nr:ABC transporter ATP-binding protein [Microbacterium yannicii]
MTTSHALLEVDALAAGYGRAGVVRDISLHVGAGEVVVLLGPNGAGKTTTLRAISKVIPASAGEVRFLGRSDKREPAFALARRGLGHLPEGRGLFFGLTVEEHFALSHPGERRISFAEALTFFPELERLRTRRAGQLSGGEQQMLALARAMARGPRLLMIDELSLGLAPIIVERLMPRVREYADVTGAGVLLVEQQVNAALRIADRGYVMARGRVRMTADAEQLIADHDLIVASYMGDSGEGVEA